uniref:Chromatin modification-related protein n=1 Tax=Kwoniella bestiolae CBS 10118 TaxID=1296100 RepID=A0A1B9FY76_9TREE|nr:hypothetical protein I302_06698 [Kwoniella bestiolae CBS 10118]OCF23715.1 hypothetical protein I302_06698 [Kwoniella bestiolae CBS 10118]
MPPRKSLSTPSPSSRPAANTSNTPKRSQSKRQTQIQLLESSPDPLAPSPEKPTTRLKEDHADDVKGDVETSKEAEVEAELEAWQDFAADHYEMVEQLPLELHRNFRLLRELDDGCLAQIQRLHELTRRYVTERLELEKQLRKSRDTPEIVTQGKEEDEEEEEEVETIEVKDQVNSPEDKDQDVEMKDQSGSDPLIGTGEYAKEAEQEKEDDKDLVEGRQVTEGVPQPDGQGGLLIPVETQDHAAKTIPPRLEFPHREDQTQNQYQINVFTEDQQVIPAQTQVNGNSESTAGSSTDKKRKRPDGPHAHLPEIARLSREVVRTAEEKVAVAVGAYNAIDRHIRALDSALTAQEAAILLGLRTSTLPSTNVDDALNLAGDSGTLPNTADGAERGEGEEELVLGLGGGAGGRSRKGKKKKGKKGVVNQPEEIVVSQEGVVPAEWNIPADPNEPKYCYCNQVSYGQMIGCENEECPLEWFHLSCLGLEQPPTGKWWCNLCRPKVGLGKGGAGKVGNRNVTGTAGGGGSRRKR